MRATLRHMVRRRTERYAITTAQAADWWGVTPKTVNEWAKNGAIRCFRKLPMGRRDVWRARESDVRRERRIKLIDAERRFAKGELIRAVDQGVLEPPVERYYSLNELDTFERIRPRPVGEDSAYDVSWAYEIADAFTWYGAAPVIPDVYPTGSLDRLESVSSAVRYQAIAVGRDADEVIIGRLELLGTVKLTDDVAEQLASSSAAFDEAKQRYVRRISARKM